MAGSLATINIRFQVFAAELRSQFQQVSRDMQSMGRQFQSVGSTMTLGITAPLAALGAASLKTYGDLEALQKGLISVMGSAEAAAAEFEKLKEVAKLPGLGLEEAVRGSVALQSAGFSADEARAALMSFGNALATVGKGARELDLVTLALTQLNNKSTGFGQDLRQLMEQLPQLRGALKSAFGTSDSEEIAKLGVSGRQVVMLLTKEFAKLPKVTGGFKNAIENTTDNLKIRFAQLGESIYKAFNIEGLLERFNNSLGKIVDNFKEMDPSIQKVVLVVSALAAASGPLLFTIGGLLKAIPLVVTGFGAVSAAALPVIAGAGAIFLAYTALTSKTKELTAAQYKQADEQKLMNELTSEATKEIAAHRVKLDQLVVSARNVNTPLADRKKAIAEINKIAPEYLGNITLETIRTDAATQAINRYNESLFKGALARAALKKIDENALKRVEAQLKYENQTYQYNLKKNAAIAKGAAESQKFFKEEGGAQERAYFRYQNTLEQLDAQDAQLKNIYGSNEAYLGLLKNIGLAESANADVAKGAKDGTIKYYEEKIKALKELQEEFETTPEAIAVLEGRIESFQKKIDALRNVKPKQVSIFEGIEVPELQSQGTIEAFDRDIAKLKEMQQQVGVTADAWLLLEEAMLALELEKEVKFDLPTESLNNFSDEFQNFGGRFIAEAERIGKATEDFNARVKQAFDAFVANSVETFATIVGQFAVGQAKLGDIFYGLGSQLADFVTEVGKALIAVGVAGLAFQSALSNPVAALAAGAIVVAAGAAFKAVLGKYKDAGGFADGGIVAGRSFVGDRLFARVNSGEMILNQDQQRRMYDLIEPAASASSLAAIEVFVTGRISGNDIELSQSRTSKINKRTRG